MLGLKCFTLSTDTQIWRSPVSSVNILPCRSRSTYGTTYFATDFSGYIRTPSPNIYVISAPAGTFARNTAVSRLLCEIFVIYFHASVNDLMRLLWSGRSFGVNGMRGKTMNTKKLGTGTRTDGPAVSFIAFTANFNSSPRSINGLSATNLLKTLHRNDWYIYFAPSTL